MKIVTQTASEMVYKYNTASRALLLGVFIIVFDIIMLSAFLKPGGPYPGLPTWAPVVLLTFIILLSVVGFLSLLSACWTTVTINKIQGQILITKWGLFGKNRAFNISDVVRVELHKISRVGSQGFPILSHQMFLNLKDETKIALGNELVTNPTNFSEAVSFGTQIAQLMNVPLQETDPYLTHTKSPIDRL